MVKMGRLMAAMMVMGLFVDVLWNALLSFWERYCLLQLATSFLSCRGEIWDGYLIRFDCTFGHL